MDKPLPMAKIRALVRTRVSERDAGAKAKPIGAGARRSRSTQSKPWPTAAASPRV